MVNYIIDKLQNTNIFITGSGGVGKSYVTKSIIAYYKNLEKKVIVLGSTGMSAVEIGGLTVHSFFKFGICKNKDELKILDRKNKNKIKTLNEILKKCDLIVIDEISMISAEIFDLIYFRIINSEFNGRILVVGDFYQLPPIIKKDEKSEKSLFSSYYAFSSYGWSMLNFKYIEMIGSKRTDDEKLYKMLSNLRIGEIYDDDVALLESLKIQIDKADENATIIFGRNNEVDRLNEYKLSLIKSPEITILGELEVKDKFINSEKIENWIKNLNVISNLRLKVGAKVLFTMNKWGEFYNGEQGVVMEILDDIIVVKKANGTQIEVARSEYNLSDIDEKKGEIILASYYQFPLKLAYAITIHKSQGMSIKNLVCDINNIFAKGQLYVALSRAMSLDNLKIIYNKKLDLKSYIQKNITIDDDIKKFYQNENFIYIHNQEIL